MSVTRLVILGNEVPEDHALWVKACEEQVGRVEHRVVDISRADWLERVREAPVDGLLAIPGNWNNAFRALYDERVTILHRELGLPVYPGLPELLLYENKKYLAYWLLAHGVPHPRTWISYHRDEALAIVDREALPLVAKTNVGAGGSGVRVLNAREECRSYVDKVFAGKGDGRRTGPKWRDPAFLGRVIARLRQPGGLKSRLQQYSLVRSATQRDFVILQAFVPHTFEWRVVRIGDAFFAHKKLVKGDKASGSLLKEYGDPPHALLTFVKDLTDRHGLRSQAVDLFEAPGGGYLVNEMQCIFGQSDPHQMILDGVPGRYLHHNGRWVFEAGDFNRLECFEARLDDFLTLLRRDGTGPA